MELFAKISGQDGGFDTQSKLFPLIRGSLERNTNHLESESLVRKKKGVTCSFKSQPCRSEWTSGDHLVQLSSSCVIKYSRLPKTVFSWVLK